MLKPTICIAPDARSPLLVAHAKTNLPPEPEMAQSPVRPAPRGSEACLPQVLGNRYRPAAPLRHWLPTERDVEGCGTKQPGGVEQGQ